MHASSSAATERKEGNRLFGFPYLLLLLLLLKKSPTNFNNDRQAHRLPPLMPAKNQKPP
jgi:hypothetical protein